MEQPEYEYLLQVALRTGHNAVIAVSRKPEPGEMLEDWLQEECELSRENDVDNGLIFANCADELLFATFVRQEKTEEPVEEVVEEEPEEKKTDLQDLEAFMRETFGIPPGPINLDHPPRPRLVSPDDPRLMPPEYRQNLATIEVLKRLEARIDELFATYRPNTAPDDA